MAVDEMNGRDAAWQTHICVYILQLLASSVFELGSWAIL